MNCKSVRKIQCYLQVDKMKKIDWKKLIKIKKTEYWGYIIAEVQGHLMMMYLNSPG